MTETPSPTPNTVSLPDGPSLQQLIKTIVAPGLPEVVRGTSTNRPEDP